MGKEILRDLSQTDFLMDEKGSLRWGTVLTLAGGVLGAGLLIWPSYTLSEWVSNLPLLQEVKFIIIPVSVFLAGASGFVTGSGITNMMVDISTNPID